MSVSSTGSVESHTTGTTGSQSEDSFTYSLTPTGDSAGIAVMVCTVSATDTITGVTYGGVSMERVSGGAAIDTATEPGRVDLFFLGSGIPTGTQDTVVTRTNNTTRMYAVTQGLAAARDTEVTGIVLEQNNQALTEENVDDGSTGVDSVRLAMIYTGLAAPPAAGANSLRVNMIDFGAFGVAHYRETTPGQGSRPVGATAASDDVAAVYFAVREVLFQTYTEDAADTILLDSESLRSALLFRTHDDQLNAYDDLLSSIFREFTFVTDNLKVVDAEHGRMTPRSGGTSHQLSADTNLPSQLSITFIAKLGRPEVTAFDRNMLTVVMGAKFVNVRMEEFSSQKRVAIRTETGGTTSSLLSAALSAKSFWCVLRMDAGNASVRCYDLDLIPISQWSLGRSYNTTEATSLIEAGTYGADPWWGGWSDVRVWGAVLTDEEVLAELRSDTPVRLANINRALGDSPTDDLAGTGYGWTSVEVDTVPAPLRGHLRSVDRNNLRSESVLLRVNDDRYFEIIKTPEDALDALDAFTAEKISGGGANFFVGDDFIVMGDEQTAIKLSVRLLEDALDIADDALKQRVLSFEISDGVTVGDALQSAVLRSAMAHDALDALDSAFGEFAVGRVLNDEVVLTDDNLTIRLRSLTVADAFILADDAQRALFQSIMLDDGTTLHDFALSAINRRRMADDAHSVTDEQENSVLRAAIERLMGDALSLTDDAPTQRVVLANAQDILALFDAVTADVVSSGTVYATVKDDELILADDAIEVAIRVRDAQDALLMADGATLQTYRNAFLGDSVSFVDTIISGALRGVVAADGAVLIDTASTFSTRSRAANDSVVFDDSALLQRSLLRLTSDDTTLQDAVNSALSWNRVALDVVDLIDSALTAVLGMQLKVVDDGVLFTDGVETVLMRRVLLEDGFALIDDAVSVRVGDPARVATDIIEVADSSALSLIRNRVMLETILGLADAATAERLRGLVLDESVLMIDSGFTALRRLLLMSESFDTFDGGAHVTLYGRDMLDLLDITDSNEYSYISAAASLFVLRVRTGVDRLASLGAEFLFLLGSDTASSLAFDETVLLRADRPMSELGGYH